MEAHERHKDVCSRQGRRERLKVVTIITKLNANWFDLADCTLIKRLKHT